MISLQILWATILVNNLLTSAAVARVYALYLSVLYFVVFLKFYLVLDYTLNDGGSLGLVITGIPVVAQS